jgi:hypothetical protein
MSACGANSGTTGWRRLVYVDEIRRQTSGNWLITQFDLSGEIPRKLVPLELNDLERAKHLVPQRVSVATAEQTDDLLPVLRPLHPLVLLDLAEAKVFFLNSKAKISGTFHFEGTPPSDPMPISRRSGSLRRSSARHALVETLFSATVNTTTLHRTETGSSLRPLPRA